MNLSIDEAAAELLREILDGTYRELKQEISHTDNSVFKMQLRERERHVHDLLEQLGGPLPDAS